MILLCILLIPIIYIVIKLGLYFIVSIFGKISYDGFSALGFAYDSKKDIFYSTKNAWQKNFGYSHLYDVGAPLFRMIIDTEPIRFYYNHKNWLITFWKGQYGIVTGAEVGIYRTTQKYVDKRTIYFPATDDEMLNMSIVLYKNNKAIMGATARHWWLTIFKLGMFSKPKELTMDIKLQFPNKDMLEAFLKAFKNKGYTSKDFKIIDNIFSFTFKKPHTKKVWTRSLLTDFITQSLNKRNVRLYNQYLSDIIDNDKVDDSKIQSDKKLIMLNDIIPDVLKNKPADTNLIFDKTPGINRNAVTLLNKNVYSTSNRRQS